MVQHCSLNCGPYLDFSHLLPTQCLLLVPESHPGSHIVSPQVPPIYGSFLIFLYLYDLDILARTAQLCYRMSSHDSVMIMHVFGKNPAEMTSCPSQCILSGEIGSEHILLLVILTWIMRLRWCWVSPL